MSCAKCSEPAIISRSHGEVIVSCDVPELGNKITDYSQIHRIPCRADDSQTFWLTVSDFHQFVHMLSHSDYFNRLEREAISLLFLETGEHFTPSKIRDSRSLQKYKEMLGAEQLSELIIKGALTTHFQPIIELQSQTIYGYESLIRGVSDDGSLIYPDKLFQWGREGDMLFYLDRACRESSLKTAAVKNISDKLFVNFIPTAIYDPEHCLQSTVKWAKQLEFNPKNIIFEVIESDLVEDMDHLKRILDFYKSEGFMVALDDVGSGYSSLNMIAKLRPDLVKIDREIIDRIDENPLNQSIFRAIVQIAKENGIIVLAEGVERTEELAFCHTNGADLVQGYYYGRPDAEPIRKI